jgi:hypothetical protein
MRNRLAALLCAMISVSTFGAARANADTFSWSAPITLDPLEGFAQYLAGVDCPSASQCTAVDGAGQAVSFDPNGSVTVSPSIIDAGRPLSSVACPSRSQCSAVDHGGSEVTFDPNAIGHPSPAPIDAGQALTALACPSTSKCVAVDRSGREVTFDPTAPGAPVLTPIETGSLTGVACASASQCTAIGPAGAEVTFDPASPGVPTPVTVLPGIHHQQNGSEAAAVACASTSQCTAVDTDGRDVTFDPTAPGTTTPVASGVRFLLEVSCPSTARCTAVGGLNEVTFDPASPANPSSSTIDPTAPGVNALACPSASQCTAVGDGSRVTFDPGAPGTPTPSTIDRSRPPLAGVACPSRSQCTAVDNQAHEVTFNPSTASASAPVSIENGLPLEAVACPSTSQCTALDAQAAAITFDPVAPDLPTRIALNYGFIFGLGALACPSISQCTAGVGNGVATFNPATRHPVYAPVEPVVFSVACPTLAQCTALEVTFDPRSSARTARIAIERYQNIVTDGLACPSAAQCTAIDEGGRVVTFNPTVSSHVVPVSVDDAPLSHVACPSVLQCTAVDAHGREVTFNPRAPRTATPTPVPGAGALNSIACGPVTYCVVVDAIGQGFAGSAPAITPGPANTAPPTVSGIAKQDRTLTERRGSWTNAPIVYSYQWEDCNRDGSGCIPIFGAAGQTYRLRASDVGHTIRIRETATNLGGPSQAISSRRTGVVKAAIARAAVRHVTVRGTRVRVTIRCRGDADTRCAVRLRLSSSATIGSATATLRGGHTRTVRLSLNRAGRHLLARRHPLRAKLRVYQSGRVVFTRRVTLGR